jgi:glycosyltransferase involved in cell wall biosynthesis
VAAKHDSLSVVILTRNEERDLPRCLGALQNFGELLVIDSGSTDRTQKIARAAGARVLENSFRSFGEQRNWTLDHARIATDWILFLDADEVATPAFRDAVQRAIRSADESIAGFYCCWKTMLGDRWLRRSDSFPKWQFRLLRRGRARFIDSGHGQKEDEIDGALGYICEPYLHHAFSKGWEAWWAKHEKYASEEAADRAARSVAWRDLLARDPSRRNRALKPLASKLPGWPLLRFLHMYVIKGGFLEGREAFTYSRNIARYEAMIRAKIRERRGT